MKKRLACLIRGHLFRICDLKGRDGEGDVTWPCHRCGTKFHAPCGLTILARRRNRLLVTPNRPNGQE